MNGGIVLQGLIIQYFIDVASLVDNQLETFSNRVKCDLVPREVCQLLLQ